MPNEWVLVDIREAYHLARGGIPGSIHLPLGMLFAAPERLPSDVEFRVRGHGDGDERLAVRFLREHGFTAERAGR